MNTSTLTPFKTRILSFSLTLGLSFPVHAQAPGLLQFVLEAELGIGDAAVQDSVRNIFLAAHFEDFQNNLSGVQVVKYDPFGWMSWETLVSLNSGIGGFAVNDMATLSDGGVAIIGDHVGGPMDDSVFVMKFDVTGGLEWSNNFASNVPGTLSSSGKRIIEASNGDLLVAGESDLLSGVLQKDTWVARLSGTGSELWTKRVETNITGTFSRLGGLDTEPGGLAIAGRTLDTDGGTWIARFDDNGGLTWSTRYATNVDDYDSFALYCLVGGFQLFVTVPYTTTNTPFAIITTDANGNFVTARSYQIPGSFGQMRRGTLLEDHSHAIAGQVEMKTGDPDAALIKLDAAGMPEWGMAYGTGSPEGAKAVAPNGDEGFTVVGFAEGDSLFMFGGGGIPTKTYVIRPDSSGQTGGCEQAITVLSDTVTYADNAFTLNVSDLVGTWVSASFMGSSNYTEIPACGVLSTTEVEQETISLYPNPASDRVQIDLNGRKADRAILRDAMGRVVLDVSITRDTRSIALGQPGAGTYFLHVLDDQLPVGRTKVVVQ